MILVLLTVLLASCAYGADTGYSLGAHLCRHELNPVVDPRHGFRLDDIIDLIIKDTDVNRNGLIDIDEARDELLAKWANGSDSVNKTAFMAAFHTHYYESVSVAGQLFDNLDANDDGVLSEVDFIMQVLDMGIIPFFDNHVDLAEFRRFLHKKPIGCVTNAQTTVSERTDGEEKWRIVRKVVELAQVLDVSKGKGNN